MKGKGFSFRFQYGLNHWMTSDSSVSPKSLRKVHWAQLDKSFFASSPPLPLVCSKLPCHRISLPALGWFCITHRKRLRIPNTAATGVVARWGFCALCPAQFDRRSVIWRPHSGGSKVDSKQTSKSFMMIQFLIQLLGRSRGNLWGYDRF